jgi:pteridine reductase
MLLTGRVALVTGAGRRIGRALAEGLAGRGATLAVHYNGSRADADDVVATIQREGGQARAFQADLRDATAPPRLVGNVVAAFGGLDVLINSAAVMLRTPFGATSAAEWDAIMALNLRAPFLLTQAAAAALTARRGAVVNIADLAAFETWRAYVPHGISKAGVVQMTRALAHALAPAVRVNAIAPGAILLPGGWSQAAGERLATTTPLGRLGAPADVVGAAVFLLEADYVTGEVLIVDGGRHVRR